MVWDVHVRVDRHDERLLHVKARWTGFGSIQDVSLECGPGVRSVSVTVLCRREMNPFSRPIEGVFRVDDDVQQPQVFLTWCDAGEPGDQAVPLEDTSHAAQHRLAGVRSVFHRRSTERFVGADGGA